MFTGKNVGFTGRYVDFTEKNVDFAVLAPLGGSKKGYFATFKGSIDNKRFFCKIYRSEKLPLKPCQTIIYLLRMRYYIGAALRQKRVSLNWKQKYVATALGISQPQLSRIENNQEGVTQEELQIISRLFNTSVEEFRCTVAIPLPINSQPKENETVQETLRRLQEVSQQLIGIVLELQTDMQLLRDENSHLRRRTG